MLVASLTALALAAAPPPKASPLDEKKTEPGAVAAAKTLKFEPKTLVDGETLQVILGQRALFRLDDKNLPVLAKVEEGKLAAAHPDGAVKEAFEAPPAGQVAAAVDGSAEKKQTVLKVWNGLSKTLNYRAVVLVMRRGSLAAVPVKVCAVAPGTVHTEAWPAPIVAVGLGRFTQGGLPAADCK